MRQAALCDRQAKVFEEEEDPASKSYFSEIIASISDAEFSRDGRLIVARDVRSPPAELRRACVRACSCACARACAPPVRHSSPEAALRVSSREMFCSTSRSRFGTWPWRGAGLFASCPCTTSCELRGCKGSPAALPRGIRTHLRRPLVPSAGGRSSTSCTRATASSTSSASPPRATGARLSREATTAAARSLTRPPAPRRCSSSPSPSPRRPKCGASARALRRARRTRTEVCARAQCAGRARAHARAGGGRRSRAYRRLHCLRALLTTRSLARSFALVRARRCRRPRLVEEGLARELPPERRHCCDCRRR